MFEKANTNVVFSWCGSFSAFSLGLANLDRFSPNDRTEVTYQ